MIPADTSPSNSACTYYYLRDSLRPLHQLLDPNASPQPARPSPTSKCGKTVLCPRVFGFYATMEELKGRFEAFLETLAKGKEVDKIRIVLE